MVGWQLVLNFGSAASTSASFVLFGDRPSQGFAEMDETSVQLSFLQLRSIFHQADGLNHTGKSLVLRCLLFSPRKQTEQRDGACLLQSFIISVARWRMISVHRNVAALTWSFKMQNYRAWRQEMAFTPLFHCSYCVALCIAWCSQLTV